MRQGARLARSARRSSGARTRARRGRCPRALSHAGRSRSRADRARRARSFRACSECLVIQLSSFHLSCGTRRRPGAGLERPPGRGFRSIGYSHFDFVSLTKELAAEPSATISAGIAETALLLVLAAFTESASSFAEVEIASVCLGNSFLAASTSALALLCTLRKAASAPATPSLERSRCVNALTDDFSSSDLTQ